MPSTALRPLLIVVSMTALPATVARIHTSYGSFQERLSAARNQAPAGTTVLTRPQMAEALGSFREDDGVVDPEEHAFLDGMLSDGGFLAGFTGAAKRYLRDYEELNDAGDVAPLLLRHVTAPGDQLLGAKGPLASAARVAEGYITDGQSLANNDTLQETYRAALADPGVREDPLWFEPITLRQLVELLGGNAHQQTPSPDEVDGAVAYLTQVSPGGAHLYAGHWHSRSRDSESAGYVIAAVSADRRFVRMLRVTSSTD